MINKIYVHYTHGYNHDIVTYRFLHLIQNDKKAKRIIMPLHYFLDPNHYTLYGDYYAPTPECSM